MRIKSRIKRALRNSELLVWALGGRKLETVKILLEAGCEVNTNDPYRTPPLVYAISELPEAIDILIDGKSTHVAPDP